MVKYSKTGHRPLMRWLGGIAALRSNEAPLGPFITEDSMGWGEGPPHLRVAGGAGHLP